MRRRILIVLAAFVLAGVSAMAVLVYARGADQRAVADRDGVWVMLAGQRIPAGTTGAQIREGNLAQRVLMPAGTVPQGTLDEVGADLDSLRLAADLAPQQLLMRGLFSRDLDTAAQAGVPDGKLAVTVQVAMAPGVAEKVTAGDDVTVFVTYPKDMRASDQQTRVLLPQATVISIESGPPQDVLPTPATTSGSRIGTGGARSDRAYPATLAVDQGDATRLVHAAQTGLIYLGLVGLETSVSPSPGVNYDNLWKK